MCAIALFACALALSLYAAQRFAAWRSGGFSAQHLIRSTQFKFSTNFHTENVRPHYAKPLLPAALLSFVVCPVLSGLSCRSVRVGYFYFLEAWKKKIEVFGRAEKGQALMQVLVCGRAFAGLA